MMFLNAVRETLTNGGGSFNAAGKPVKPARRFVVGGKVASVRVPAALPAEILAGEIRDFARGAPGEIIGTWNHEGEIHIDACDTWASLPVALNVATRRGELAIYDSETGRVIETGVKRPLTRWQAAGARCVREGGFDLFDAARVSKPHDLRGRMLKAWFLA